MPPTPEQALDGGMVAVADFTNFNRVGRAARPGQVMAFALSGPSYRLAPFWTGRRKHDLRWPSGEGDEVAVARLGLEEAWSKIVSSAERLPLLIRVTRVEEGGARAIIVQGLPANPLSFATERGAPEGLLGIYADREASPAQVERSLGMVLSPDSFSLHR